MFCNAHILGMKDLTLKGMNKIYNLGTGKGFSVREVIEHTQKITNKDILVKKGDRRPGDCTKLVSSSLLIQKELGWKPLRSNLDEIIKDAWRWHKTGQYLK